MPEPIPKRLADLRELDKVALTELWRQFFDASPPLKIRRDLMIPILAYRIQEKAFGPLKVGVRTRLRQLAAGFSRNPELVLSSRPVLKTGTRLVREWRDEVHLVNVESLARARERFVRLASVGSSAAAGAVPSTSCIRAMGAESPGRGTMRRMRV